jgi:hypothetical protein
MRDLGAFYVEEKMQDCRQSGHNEYTQFPSGPCNTNRERESENAESEMQNTQVKQERGRWPGEEDGARGTGPTPKSLPSYVLAPHR